MSGHRSEPHAQGWGVSRHGYATRAALLLLGYLREHTDTERPYLVVEEHNTASLGVARSAGGQLVEPVTNLSGRPNLWYVVELRSQA